MSGKSIYPSIPAPGQTQESQRATLDAMRQTLTMMILNAQVPSANYTPSSAAQVFVTTAQLQSLGLVNSAGQAATPTAIQDQLNALSARITKLGG